MESPKGGNKNYAFIDSQNVYLGIRQLGWSLDWRRFRIYLKEKHAVEKAFIFIGYIKEHQNLYTNLQKMGYLLVFKPTISYQKETKGNVDADMVLYIMKEWEEYHKAIVISGDGDFYSTVQYLSEKNKLKTVIAPSKKYCSGLLQRFAKQKIMYLDVMKQRFEYKKSPK